MAADVKEPKTSLTSALDFALADASRPVTESSGPNRSAQIDEINRFAGSPLGSPYCAAGVSWCFHQAGASHFPFSPLAKSIRDWFAERGLMSEDPDSLLHWDGALFGWTNPDGHGHIGFVKRRLTNSAGHVVAIQTVEYNTHPQDAAGPDGVWERRRLAAPGRMWLLRCDGFPGVAWWKD